MHPVYVGLTVVVLVFGALQVYALGGAARDGEPDADWLSGLASLRSANGTPFFASKDSMWRLIDELEEATGGLLLSDQTASTRADSLLPAGEGSHLRAGSS